VSYRGKEALRHQKLQLENDKANRKRQLSKDSDNHPQEPIKQWVSFQSASTTLVP
jgi:hypothetical protein